QDEHSDDIASLDLQILEITSFVLTTQLRQPQNDGVCVFRVFSKHNDSPVKRITAMVTGHLEGGKLARHKIVREVLDYDPAENQDWDWEDYE
ncbi:MAG: hypothetical protein P8O70_01020, partial [SAR324 cluster bacterium]|nr:hypothetical protein [SAR324 cluster bacterium]